MTSMSKFSKMNINQNSVQIFFPILAQTESVAYSQKLHYQDSYRDLPEKSAALNLKKKINP